MSVPMWQARSAGLAARRALMRRALVVDLLGEQQTLHYDRHDGVGVDWDVVALEAVDVPWQRQIGAGK